MSLRRRPGSEPRNFVRPIRQTARVLAENQRPTYTQGGRLSVLGKIIKKMCHLYPKNVFFLEKVEDNFVIFVMV